MSGVRLKRSLAAIVMADVVGYSRLMGADEAGALARLKACRAQAAGIIALRGGRLVDATGDSLLMEFASVVDAVEAAIAIQQGLARDNAAAAPDRRLELRIGVNIGDVLVENGALYGDGVNVAARLQALAPAGGICLSRGAVEQLHGKLDIAFVALGPQTVKNIARPVEAFRLSAAAIAALPQRDASPPRRQRRWRAPAAAAVAALVLALAGYRLWRPVLHGASQLDAALAAHEPGLDAARRARLLADYRKLKPHRAFVFAPKAASHWWSGDWPSEAEAEEKALERCAIRFGEPCALAALDDAFVAGAPAREMARVSYAGKFDPERIPGVRRAVAARADVAGYATAPGAKAAAIHARGVLAVSTGAPTQSEAQARALKLCNSDDGARDADGVCFLYAVGDDVVLGRRLTAPADGQ